MTTHQARKLLSKKYEMLSDNKIELLVGQLQGLAEIVLDSPYLRGSNKHLEVIDSNERKEQNGN